MKLASLERGREGRLFVVSDDMGWQVSAAEVAPTLGAAIADWERCEPLLRGVAEFLNRGAQRYVRFEPTACQAFCRGQFEVEGAIVLARGATAIVGALAKGSSREAAAAAVRLVQLHLVGPQGAAESPLAVSVDALGEAWKAGRLSCAPMLEQDGVTAAATPVVLDFAAAIAEAARSGDIAAGTRFSLTDPRPVRLAKLVDGEMVRYELRDALSRSTFGAIELRAKIAQAVKERA